MHFKIPYAQIYKNECLYQTIRNIAKLKTKKLYPSMRPSQGGIPRAPQYEFEIKSHYKNIVIFSFCLSFLLSSLYLVLIYNTFWD